MPAVPLTEDQIEDGLHSPFKLGPLQFTFSLPGGASFWESTAGNYDASNQQPTTDYSLLSAAQANNFRAALTAWDLLIAPNFTEVTDDAVSHGEVRIAFTSFSMDPGTAGYAFQGSNQTPTSIVGDIWLNASSTGDSFDAGTNDFSTLIHEIGHVLGLKHPFEPTVIPDPYETTRYSVMSYTEAGRLVTFGGGGGSISSSSVAVATATPMVLDIAAVQSLYGADPNTNVGDTVYVFNETDAFLQSIYDAGGTDTLDLSAIARPNIIDLTPGAYSSVAQYSVEAQAAYWKPFYNAGLHAFIDNALAQPGTYTWTDNVGIAFSTTIENVIGGSGNDTITGNAVANTLISGAGTDILNGAAGDDVLYYGAFLSAGDEADGGADRDAIVLQGNYAYTFNDGNMFNVESISVQSGSVTRWGDTANNFYDYDLTTHDDNVASGQQMIVNGQSLRVGEDFTFDGSAETDGRFLFYGGNGVENAVGGIGNDIFFFEGSRFGASDSVHGGAGRDALVIAGGSGLNAFFFADSQFSGIEAVSFNNRFATDPSQMPTYQLTLANGNVAAGEELIVNASSLGATQTLVVNASLETDGRLVMFGGAADDTFVGGGDNDILYGGEGADALTGGGGNDAFRYDAVSHSTPGARDSILDFTLGDVIDLSRIDADSGAGGDQAFAFIGSAAFSNTAGELRFENQSGSTWLVQGDIDGNGTADLELLVTVSDVDPITSSDFVL